MDSLLQTAMILLKFHIIFTMTPRKIFGDLGIWVTCLSKWHFPLSDDGVIFLLLLKEKQLHLR